MEKQTSRVERRNFLNNSLFSDGGNGIITVDCLVVLLLFIDSLIWPGQGTIINSPRCAMLSQARVFNYHASVFSYRLCRENEGEGKLGESVELPAVM
jgi:hypothetical protein